MYISLIIDYVVNYHVKIILEISNNELLFYEYFRNLDEIEHLSYFKFKYFLTQAKKKILPLTYFISDYYRSEKSCFGILFKKEQRRSDSYSNSFSISFYRNFLPAAITDKSIRW